MAVADLWIQQKAKNGEVHYKKLEGSKNVSDILTKPVESEVLDRHMAAMGFEFRSGRNELTPDFDGDEKGLMDDGRGQVDGPRE